MRKWIVFGGVCLCLAAAATGAWAFWGRSRNARVPGEVARLFTQRGWRMEGDITEHRITIPPSGPLRSGNPIEVPPWSWYLGLSKDAGLDFSPYAGREVTAMSFGVRDSEGKRLSNYHLIASVLIDDGAGMIGAWICAPEETPGEIKPGEFRCYTLGGDQVR